MTFLKRILKLVQSGYSALREIEIDMQFAKENETYQMPDPKQYGRFHKKSFLAVRKLMLDETIIP